MYLIAGFGDSMNLREVQQRFGKGAGLNIAAVKMFAQQILKCLAFLHSQNLVNCDLKVCGMSSAVSSLDCALA